MTPATHAGTAVAPGTSAGETARAPRWGWVHVARLSLREAVNRKLVVAALGLGVAFLALFTAGVILIARNQGGALDAVAASVLTSLGLYALHFLGAFLALMISAGAVAGDIDSGALHALLARPLSRRAFLLGRWLALAGLTCVYVVAMGVAITVVSVVVTGYEPLSASRAVALLAFETLLLVTLGVWWSTRLSTVATGVALFCLFSIAWVAGFIEFLGEILGNATMVNLGIAVSLLIPADALWRGASYYSQAPVVLATSGQQVPLFGLAPPTAVLLVYSGLYVLACLGLALRSFANRDI